MRGGRLLGRATGRRAERVLGLLALMGVAVSTVLSLVVSPPDAEQGDLIRLMYIHVPAAWLAYLSFSVVFVASVAYLRTGRSRWDRLAAASAEVGVVFTALTIVLGAIWAKPVWGTWWTWDPRLTTTAILLLIYVGYLAVRRLPETPSRRGRWAAVVGIAGFVDVPIVHLSVRWWRSLHQPPARLLGVPNLAPAMGVALMAGIVAFTLAYAYLLVVRLRVGRAEDRQAAEAIARLTAAPSDPRLEEVTSRG
ncbi:MAG TPA: cytochrome c biogenesis protein CcsA [Actinomycetota bacterium]|nr:cytochrome c biogenesis protein CcsA [Actinomycetota bacterium]